MPHSACVFNVELPAQLATTSVANCGGDSPPGDAVRLAAGVTFTYAHLMDVCGWCGFTPMGGDVQRCNGHTFCHGPGVPEPTCWQQVESEGRVIAADFGRSRLYVEDGGVDPVEE